MRVSVLFCFVSLRSEALCVCEGERVCVNNVCECDVMCVSVMSLCVCAGDV